MFLYFTCCFDIFVLFSIIYTFNDHYTFVNCLEGVARLGDSCTVSAWKVCLFVLPRLLSGVVNTNSDKYASACTVPFNLIMYGCVVFHNQCFHSSFGGSVRWLAR